MDQPIASRLPGVAPVYNIHAKERRKPRSWAWRNSDDVYSTLRTDGTKFKRWLPAEIAQQTPLDATTSPKVLSPSAATSTMASGDDDYLGSLGQPSLDVAPIPVNRTLLDEAKWPKAEVEMLIELAERFNYRWPLVADRWPFSPAKSSIDLREQFYSIAELDEPIFSFDAANERVRSRELDMQFQRPRESELKEARLMEKISTLDAKLIKYMPSHRRPVQPTSKLEMTAENVNELVMLRSHQLDPRPHPALGLGPQLAAKLVEMLTLLEVPSQPLPTSLVCSAYEDLRRDCVRLFALKKDLKAKQHQLSLALTKVEPEQAVPDASPPSAVPSPSTSAAAAAVGTAADVAVESVPISASPPPPSSSPAAPSALEASVTPGPGVSNDLKRKSVTSSASTSKRTRHS